MALKSDDLDLELVRKLEDEADTLSIELDGKVNLLQSKNGVVLLRDELKADIVVEILKRFIEDAVRNLVKSDGPNTKEEKICQK